MGTSLNLNILSSQFSDNKVDAIFFIESALILEITSSICLSTLNINGDATCFHFKNILSMTIYSSVFLSCYSSTKTPGIIIESSWDKKSNVLVRKSFFTKVYFE